MHVSSHFKYTTHIMNYDCFVILYLTCRGQHGVDLIPNSRSSTLHISLDLLDPTDDETYVMHIRQLGIFTNKRIEE